MIIPKNNFRCAHSIILINLYHSLGLFSRCQIGDIFLIFPRKPDLTFYANCLTGNKLHEMSNQVFWEKYEKKIHLLKILLRVLRVEVFVLRKNPLKGFFQYLYNVKNLYFVRKNKTTFTSNTFGH